MYGSLKVILGFKKLCCFSGSELATECEFWCMTAEIGRILVGSHRIQTLVIVQVAASVVV